MIMMLSINQVFAQISYVKNDSAKFKKAEMALSSVITQSNYIIETVGLTLNYYYIAEDDQTYWRTIMRITRVLRGTNVQVGDTIISIWKQKDKGKGIDEYSVRHHGSGEPRLWYDKKSTSCIFLTDSKYPAEPVADEWSRFKHTTYIPSSIGYFAALYVDENGHRRVSFESGIRFSRMTDWYNFLKQFPNVNAPMRY